jgi:DNA end-binding protein Ku
MTMTTPRAVWKGSITFGLINIPCKLYSLVNSQAGPQYRSLCTCGGYTGIKVYCKDCGQEHGTQAPKKAYVTQDEREVEIDTGGHTESSKTCSTVGFLPSDSKCIPRLAGTTYSVRPDSQGNGICNLLYLAMESEAVLALVRLTVRGRLVYGLLRPQDGHIFLDVLRYSEEIRSPSDVSCEPLGGSPDPEELQMARQLICKAKIREISSDMLANPEISRLEATAKDLPDRRATKAPEGAKIVSLKDTLEASLKEVLG